MADALSPEVRAKILAVISQADGGGCSSCVSGLIDGLVAVFPGVPWLEEWSAKGDGAAALSAWSDEYDRLAGHDREEDTDANTD